MAPRQHLSRALWLALLVIHGTAILYGSLPSSSLKASLAPKTELPGIWALEGTLVWVKQHFPGGKILGRYNETFAFNQTWMTFAPRPPIEDKYLTVLAEYADGSAKVLWRSTRAIFIRNPSLRTNKFAENLFLDEGLRFHFLKRFYRLEPSATRIVLVLERVTVPHHLGETPSSSGEYVYFEVLPDQEIERVAP